MPSFRAMPISLLLLACCALLAPAGVLRAQVRRCTMPDGTTVFTDRRCTDLGATERKPEPPAPLPSAGGGARFYRGCARNLQDLAYELTTALDDHDVNRLAGVVDWVGMSSKGGYALMDRLDAIAQRPLVDLAPVYPEVAGEPADYHPQATVRRAPVGLRVEQTLSNGTTPAHVVFGLKRYLGCWWLRP